MGVNNEHLLMVQPDNFEVKYTINPWMQDHVGTVEKLLARQQWHDLHDILSQYAVVTLLPSVFDMPDLVFSANAAVVNCDTAVIANFYHSERQSESPIFERWFRHQDFKTVQLDSNIVLEGAGDALLDPNKLKLWLGYGQRSSLMAANVLEELFEIEVLPLRLTDPMFYHLDTCFCPLNGGHVLYYPSAFDEASQQLIAKYYSEEQRIIVDAEDAARFTCNCVNLSSNLVVEPGGVLVMSCCSDALQQRLHDFGYHVLTTPVSEFIKAGGSVKCLTLSLNQCVRANHFS